MKPNIKLFIIVTVFVLLSYSLLFYVFFNSDVFSSPQWSSSYPVKYEDVSSENGFNIQIFPRERVTFEFNGNENYIGLVNINELVAQVEVNDEFNQEVIAIGQSMDFNLDGEGENEITLTLLAFSNGSALFDSKGFVKSSNRIVVQPMSKKKGMNFYLGIVIVLLIVVTLALIYLIVYLIKRNKRTISNNKKIINYYQN